MANNRQSTPPQPAPWHDVPATGPILRYKAAAEYLGISKSAFFRLIAEGHLPQPIALTAGAYPNAAKGYPRPWLDAVIAARASEIR
jgi:predicted DNA-binding transcriptional regulator AlpA